MSRHPVRRRAETAAALISGALLAATLLAGCTPTTVPTTAPTATAPTTVAPTSPVSESPTPSKTPPPSLHPDGSARDNLRLFAAVTSEVWRSDDRGEGRAYIDALVAAGFDKAAMQVTRDRTTVGNPAESIQFSVLWGADCLVGQVGPATGRPVTTVLPALGDGVCLIGDTRPIDW